MKKKEYDVYYVVCRKGNSYCILYRTNYIETAFDQVKCLRREFPDEIFFITKMLNDRLICDRFKEHGFVEKWREYDKGDDDLV